MRATKTSLYASPQRPLPRAALLIAKARRLVIEALSQPSPPTPEDEAALRAIEDDYDQLSGALRQAPREPRPAIARPGSGLRPRARKVPSRRRG
mgnify:CR=1 FL=1